MDKKTMTIVIVAAIIIVAAAAAALILTNNGGDKNDGGEEKAVIETGRVVIYGNANNDDYLDSRDITFIQNIIDGKTTWDKTKNPFADTNTDGKITSDDVTLLQKFIDKKEATMYYYTCLGTVDSIEYPITGNIAVNFSYGLDAAIVLGCYDRVVAADHQTVSVASSTETKYPGLSKLVDIGDPREDAEELVKQVKNNNVEAIFGYSGSRITTIEDNVAKSGSEIYGINLTLNHTEAYSSDKYGSILTLGIMLGCEDRAYEFIEYVNKVTDYIDSKNATEKTYVMPEYEEGAPGSTSTTWIMTTSQENWSSGCNHTVEYLPLKDLYYKQFSGGFVEVEIEDIITKNPDFIILSSWGVVNENMSMEEILTTLKPFYDVYKNTQAYKNNQIYCIAYESYGPVPGIAGDVLLGSYLWPDVYSESVGWQYLQEYYDKYTKMDVDVKKVPTLSPFKLKDVIEGTTDDDDEPVVETGRVVIFGNANNDDYLDDRDVKFIQNIIDGKATWDKEKNPYADTNTDGKITSDDVALLQKFIDKKEATMYYYTCLGTVDSIKYPITGNLAVNFSYGLDAAIVLGCYDRVVAVDNQTMGVDSTTETKYPGLSTRVNVGDPRDDAEALVKQVKENNVQAVFGYSGSRITTIEDNVAKSGAEIYGINLTLNHTEAYSSDKYGSILTLGIMLGCEERAYEFIKYVDKVTGYIDSKNAPQKTYVMPEYEDGALGSTSTTWIMTTSQANWASGCNHTVEYLPLTDMYYKQFSGGFVEVEVEDIVVKNPDVIILCSWGFVNENMSMDEILTILKPFYDVYKNTQAYKNNQVYCIAYESYGPVPGIAGDVLLGSYLWPDVYDEAYGWELLQEYYDKFTLMDVDVKNIPTLSPFKLKDVY